MIPLIYVAGPYTTPDPVENTHNAIVAAERLEEMFNVAVFIPHLSLLWHLVRPAKLDVWYERDLHVLERCDALYRIPGLSTGADNEVAHAKRYEIPVYYHDDPMGRFSEWRQDWTPSR